jgi:hypothetical protein
MSGKSARQWLFSAIFRGFGNRRTGSRAAEALKRIRPEGRTRLGPR